MKKMLAALVAGLMLLGVPLLTAAPASAHTGSVSGVATCEADGTYTVTWTYRASRVPAGTEAETKAMTTNRGTLAPVDGVLKGGQVFLSVWSEHQINVPGAPVRTGDWAASFKTIGVPGDYRGEVTTMVQTDWLRGPSEDPVGQVVVDGSCSRPIPEQPSPRTDVKTWQDAPVCASPLDGTATVTTWAQDLTYPQVWSAETWSWIEGPAEAVGDPYVLSTETIPSEDCAPPVLPADPSADIQVGCGYAVVAVTNAGGVRLTASFVIYVDGEFSEALAVPAGGEQSRRYTFDEDSGDHVITVRTGPAHGDEQIAATTVGSDCVAPPVVPEQPGTPTPVVPEQPVAVGPQTAALAHTGSGSLILGVLAGLALSLGTLLVVKTRRAKRG